jgi:hypothetical protein
VRKKLKMKSVHIHLRFDTFVAGIAPTAVGVIMVALIFFASLAALAIPVFATTTTTATNATITNNFTATQEEDEETIVLFERWHWSNYCR